MTTYEPSFDERSRLEQTVRTAAEATVAAMLRGDYEDFIARCDPIVVAMYGGETQAREYLRGQFEELKSELEITGCRFEPGPAFFRAADELQALVHYEVQMVAPGAHVQMRGFMVGISEDDGVAWRFVGASTVDKKELRRYFPNLSPAMEFPPEEEPIITEIPIN